MSESRGNGTGPIVLEDATPRRRRRPSFQPWRAWPDWAKTATALFALSGLLVGLGAAWSSKADADDLRVLDRRHDRDVHRLEKVLIEGRYEQQMLIIRIAPDLADHLAPLPPVPEEPSP